MRYVYWARTGSDRDADSVLGVSFYTLRHVLWVFQQGSHEYNSSSLFRVSSYIACVCGVAHVDECPTDVCHDVSWYHGVEQMVAIMCQMRCASRICQ